MSQPSGSMQSLPVHRGAARGNPTATPWLTRALCGSGEHYYGPAASCRRESVPTARHPGAGTAGPSERARAPPGPGPM